MVICVFVICSKILYNTASLSVCFEANSVSLNKINSMTESSEIAEFPRETTNDKGLIMVANEDQSAYFLGVPDPDGPSWKPIDGADAFMGFEKDSNGTITGRLVEDGKEYNVDPMTGKALEEIIPYEERRAA